MLRQRSNVHRNHPGNDCREQIGLHAAVFPFFVYDGGELALFAFPLLETPPGL